MKAMCHICNRAIGVYPNNIFYRHVYKDEPGHPPCDMSLLPPMRVPGLGWTIIVAKPALPLFPMLDAGHMMTYVGKIVGTYPQDRFCAYHDGDKAVVVKLYPHSPWRME